MNNRIKTDFENTFKNFLSKKEINLKENFLNKFIKNGFPNKKLENWKFSDLNQIINKNIGELSFFNDPNKKHDFDKSIIIDQFEHNKIVFVNGNLKLKDFNFEQKENIEIIQTNEINLDMSQKNSLLDLNCAFVNSNYKIVVKKNYLMKKPLIIYHITNDQIKSTNINLQLNFEIEKNSSIKVLDIFNDTSEKNFINIFYNFNLKEDSILKNYKIDCKKNRNIKYSYNNINQEKNSISENFILSCSSNFMKNEINCNLRGKYASAFVNGILYLDEEKHHEIRTKINHLVENTKSYQLIKCVLDENAKAVYQGKIFVNSEAQKTDGYQLSKAILLNKSSEFNAKPELEIYADDVKCSHGSASGSLNENSIFYLRSRGLNYKEAKKLLINGFILDVIDKITDDEIKTFVKKTMSLN